MKMKLKKLMPIIVVLFLVGSFALSGKFSRSKVVVEQELLEVVTADIENNIYTTGTVTTEEVRKISFIGSGIMETINVSIGDHVNKGDLLGVINSENLSDSLTSKEIALDIEEERLNQITLEGDASLHMELTSSKRALNNSKKAYEDNLALFEKNVISKSSLDSSKSEYDSAYERFKNAEERLNNSTLSSQVKVQKKVIESMEVDIERLKKEIQKTFIRSTIDGNVVEINVKDGEAFTADNNMFKVINLEELFIKTHISESEINKVKLGQSVKISGVSIRDKDVSGEVYYIAPGTKKLDGKKQAYVEIRIRINEKIEELRPDFSVNLVINTDKRENVKAVKFEAIHTDSDGHKYIVAKTGELTERKDITLGIEGDVYVEIVSDDINPGDQVLMSDEYSANDNSEELISF